MQIATLDLSKTHEFYTGLTGWFRREGNKILLLVPTKETPAEDSFIFSGKPMQAIWGEGEGCEISEYYEVTEVGGATLIELTIKDEMTETEKAYEIYLSALNQAEGNLSKAALIADRKGYNWTVDYQDEWYSAVANCDYQTYQ